MNIPFAPGAQPHDIGPKDEPPASHVGRPHASHPPQFRVTLKVGDSSSDVLPDRVRPRGEPMEESEREPPGKARRKGRRRRRH